MITITTTEALAQFCERARAHPYVTIDTEFLRERTYYSKLCLVQLAVPGDAEEDAVLVDPLVMKPWCAAFPTRHWIKRRGLPIGRAAPCRMPRKTMPWPM